MGDEKRYVVLKASGSRFAYVQDTHGPRTVKRYNIFRNYGRFDGWTAASRHMDALNAEHVKAQQPAGAEGE